MQLTITIQDEKIISAEREKSGKVGGTVNLEPLREQTIDFLVAWLKSDGPKSREGLKVLGSHLYLTIFDNTMDTFFVQALNESKAKKEKLRVKLEFGKNAGRLAKYPWEFLYRPNGDDCYFLSTRIELTLSRYVPLTDVKESEPEKTRLKVLVAFAEPLDDLTNRADDHPNPAIIQEMKTFFDELGKRNMEVHFLEKTTIDSLPQRLDEVNPHVLHFIGHGMNDISSKVSKVGILDNDNHLIQTQSEFFANYILNEDTRAQRSNLRLVSLQLSDCLHPVFDRKQYAFTFADVAPALILAGIPAVVAMQFPLAGKVAQQFFKSFYEQLAKGETIDRAVQSGRQKISEQPDYQDLPFFGTPILFMNVIDHIIVAPDEPNLGTDSSNRKISTPTPKISVDISQPTQAVPSSSINPLNNVIDDIVGARKEPNLGTDGNSRKVSTPPPELSVDIRQPTQFVPSSSASPINLVALTKAASRAMADINLSDAGKNDIGRIYDKLYEEKERGGQNYRQVLFEERRKNPNPDVKLVITSMLDELTTLESRNV